SQLTRKDVKEIVIATDAGREGELVARWIIQKARVNKPIKRLWISSVTDKAIRDGFNQLKPGAKYENLYDAAVARSEADWYVGLNATRALTTKFNAQLSSGRVQTPTLAMIAEREKEIQNFKPTKFYGLEVKTRSLTLKWQDKKNNQRISSKERAEKLRNQLTDKKATVTNVERSYKKKHAPQLYDLTELQRDANRIFNYSGKQTLSIMQNLYERHKVLTYPRTDSRVISSDIVPTLKDRIKACGVDEYAKIAGKFLRLDLKLSKADVDNQKVSDHHAIIPTEEPVMLNDLDDKERKIFDLVVKRFLAVLSEPYEYEQVTVTADISGETFTTKGKTVKNQGWKEIYDHRFAEDEDETKEQRLPLIEKNQTITDIHFKQTTGQTKPPARFTEGTLLQAMENPARYMEKDEKHLAKTIHQTGGLGTVATRADIIEKLFHNQYMEMRGKHIFTTSTGKQLLELVPEDLASPALTAEWENKLSLIAEGKLTKNTFIADMKNYAKEVVSEIKASDATFKHDNITGTKCPECGKLMLEINNKKGRMLVCQDRSCGHKKNIAKITNARCPNCHKRLELRGEGEGKMFICKCGHREKLSAFNKRKQKEKKHNVSKKDVRKYLNRQDDGFKNNALADALAKLKK